MNYAKLQPWSGLGPLSAFEREVLERIGMENDVIRESLSSALLSLRVTERELTGVGAYIDFDCENDFGNLDGHFGISPLLIPTLKWGLTVELACKDGKPLFLELISTDGEPWNGDVTGFAFSDADGMAR